MNGTHEAKAIQQRIDRLLNTAILLLQEPHASLETTLAPQYPEIRLGDIPSVLDDMLQVLEDHSPTLAARLSSAASKLAKAKTAILELSARTSIPNPNNFAVVGFLSSPQASQLSIYSWAYSQALHQQRSARLRDFSDGLMELQAIIKQ